MLQTFNLHNPAWIKPRLNYVASFPGGGTGTLSYMQGPSDARLKMGSVWAFEIRVRITLTTTQYIFKITHGTNELGILRNFSPNINRFAAWGQGGNSFNYAFPIDTVTGVFYKLRVESDGAFIRLYFNDTLVRTEAKVYSYPDSSTVNPFLLVGTGNPNNGAMYGDIDYLKIEKNGSILCLYDMAPYISNNEIKDTVGVLPPLISHPSIIINAG